MRNAFLALLLATCLTASGQHTFSIVAIDTATGEIGSAGASCLDASAISTGVMIISDILPGRGAIHTQAQWNSANQNAARTRMLAGDSPQQVIQWLVANDVQGDPSVRQYGIVDTDGNGVPRSAGYTGANCFAYANHITGPGYAIQGNILLGQGILDSMEARYLRTTGTLAERLMAALQGANVPGADTRCLSEGVSSLSAFLRVSKPWDIGRSYYLELLVDQTPFGQEPIDSLQTLFNAWVPPVCEVSIPAQSVRISRYTDTTASNAFFWVCPGDTLRISGNSNTVYLEPGATAILASGFFPTVYVPAGARLITQAAIGTNIFHTNGSLLESIGNTQNGKSCDTLFYDYSQAPAGTCASANSLDDLPRAEFRLSQQGRVFEVALAFAGPATLYLYDFTGREIWEGEVKSPAQTLDFERFPAGFYLLRVNQPGRYPVAKKVWLP